MGSWSLCRRVDAWGEGMGLAGGGDLEVAGRWGLVLVCESVSVVVECCGD